MAHGYPPGADGRVWVALTLTGNAIEITYEDAAPPFDPFGAPAAAAHSVAERPVGGVGLALVRGLSATRRYARVGDRNRVVLTVALGASAASPPNSP